MTNDKPDGTRQDTPEATPAPAPANPADPKKQAEMNEAIQAGMQRAVQAGQYMVAIFRIEDNKVKMERTSVNFPVVDFPACPKILEANLGQEATASAEGLAPEKMEAADPQPPVVELFGADPQQPDQP